MLNRRILRIKAFEVLYSYAVTGGPSLKEAEKQLDASCEAVRDLYLFMLALVSPLTQEAQKRIDAAKNKINPSPEDLAPNMKFAGNRLSRLLDSDPDFQKILKNKGLSWEQYDIIVRGIYDGLKDKEYFCKYMASPIGSLKEDSALFTRIFEEELVENSALDALLEEKSMFWTDCLAYALTQCCRTFSDFSRGKTWQLPELYMSDMTRLRDPSAKLQSDSDFVHKLLRNAYSGFERYSALVKEKAVGWESDRLFCTDTTLIVLGLAETETFPDIPRSVTINEYVEISKFFCPLGSGSFINGLLDTITRENIKK